MAIEFGQIFEKCIYKEIFSFKSISFVISFNKKSKKKSQKSFFLQSLQKFKKYF